jgi:hypothetical protein
MLAQGDTKYCTSPATSIYIYIYIFFFFLPQSSVTKPVHRVSKSIFILLLSVINVIILIGCLGVATEILTYVGLRTYGSKLGREFGKVLEAAYFNHIYLTLNDYGLTDCVLYKTICPACSINFSCFVFSLEIRSLSFHLFPHPRHVLTMLSCCSRGHGQLLHVTQILSCSYTCFTVPIAITL